MHIRILQQSERDELWKMDGGKTGRGERDGNVRDYVRRRNIKRASVMEMGQLLVPTAAWSEQLPP
jgi:hypothetical protein